MKQMRYFFILILLLINTLQSNLAANANRESRKVALIFGVTGQDGTYLKELLLSKNYEVHGVARRAHSPWSTSLEHPNRDHYFHHIGDLTHSSHIKELIGKIRPDEIYNLAAQSSVPISFEKPEETAKINATGTLNILDAIKIFDLTKKTKFFQAASSELFGLVNESPQTEETSFYPRSPYGVTKLFAYWMTVNYRESYKIFACNGILFNHESPLRGESFVTRKITLAASNYKMGRHDILFLGNLDSKRDWGYAKDYVEAIWLMLQQDTPNDYIISTGEVHSVREFVELAYQELGIKIEWHGEGIEEYGVDKETGKTIIKIDPQYYRPIETGILVGNSEKAEKILKWKPKTTFKELVKIMIDADSKTRRLKNGAIE